MWAEMRQNALHASEILSGDYESGLDPAMEIEHLVLNDKGSAVEYVVINADRTPWSYYVNDGYVTWDSVDVEAGPSADQVDLRGESADTMSGPEEIDITAQEADKRLVSRVIDSSMRIGEDDFHQIQDVLIHPQSGKITHYVISTTPGTIFATDRRAVPAKHVKWQNERFTTDLDMQKIENMQEYDPGLL